MSYPLATIVIGILEEGHVFQQYTPDVRQQIENIIRQLIINEITPDDAKGQCLAISGSTEVIDKAEIILKSLSDTGFDPATFVPSGFHSGFRKKAQRWTPEEDARLLEAIQNLGTDNWNAVALQVGNGRTKSQCAQRWHRCLDPGLCKSNWDRSEEEHLIAAVNQFGDKAWTKVAQEMKNRSDVQCRFRYKFLLKKQKEFGYDTIQPVSPVSLTAPNTEIGISTHDIIEAVTESSFPKNE